MAEDKRVYPHILGNLDLVLVQQKKINSRPELS